MKHPVHVRDKGGVPAQQRLVELPHVLPRGSQAGHTVLGELRARAHGVGRAAGAIAVAAWKGEGETAEWGARGARREARTANI